MNRSKEPFATEAGAAIPPGDPSAHLPEGAPSRRWRLVDRLILVAAAAGLLVPASLLAAGLKPREIENRPLLGMPAASIGGLLDGTWFKGVDAFLADNVAVRPYAIRLRGEAYFLSGGTGTTDVLRGKGDWLFPTNAFDPLCTHSVDEITASLRQAAAAFATAGVTFRFLVVPDKQTIYPEKIAYDPFPPACTDLGRSTLRTAIAGLGADAIDDWTLAEAAKAAAPGVPLWYAGDTHWTSAGALTAVRALVASLTPTPWSESEIVTGGQSSHSDDLARGIGITRTELQTTITARPEVKVVQTDVPVRVVLHNAPSIFTTTVQTDQPTAGGRTLIVYDSAFNEQLALVAPWFADATWVHIGDLQQYPGLAQQLGPFDTVIVERVERMLYGDRLGALFSGFQPS